jgi:beta-N-acetylhexosaminidase
MTLLFAVARLGFIAALLPYALDWRSPMFASVRLWALCGFILCPLAIGLLEIWLLSTNRAGARMARAISMIALTSAVLALGSTLALEARFHWMRNEVLRADPRQLERLGRHVIVGYRDLAELRDLIERRAVAGIFIGARNVRGNTVDEIRQLIAALQDIRRHQGLSPLWIATDQEGGAVERLSPPLARSASLADIVNAQSDTSERASAVKAYASRQGRDLADIGVNLNFAPVVDLNHRVVNPEDRLTRIHERAISADPFVVADVADHYCAALWQAGVRCTLKHFPGLGRVYEDTHRESADLTVGMAELSATDWVPFRALMHRAGTFTMLGHVRLTAIDRERPASFSKAVITGLLRGDWRSDAILITDDFCMGAVTDSREGIGAASVATLNAGADLILVSYDPDQYYPVMHALLKADAAGRLRQDVLGDSNRRLSGALTARPDGTAATSPKRPN